MVKLIVPPLQLTRLNSACWVSSSLPSSLHRALNIMAHTASGSMIQRMKLLECFTGMSQPPSLSKCLICPIARINDTGLARKNQRFYSLLQARAAVRAFSAIFLAERILVPVNGPAFIAAEKGLSAFTACDLYQLPFLAEGTDERFLFFHSFNSMSCTGRRPPYTGKKVITRFVPFLMTSSTALSFG